ncbi:hypothetical protein POF50_021655, partial [Streptomyces sp. SL13]
MAQGALSVRRRGRSAFGSTGADVFRPAGSASVLGSTASVFGSTADVFGSTAGASASPFRSTGSASPFDSTGSTGGAGGRWLALPSVTLRERRAGRSVAGRGGRGVPVSVVAPAASPGAGASVVRA